MNQDGTRSVSATDPEQMVFQQPTPGFLPDDGSFSSDPNSTLEGSVSVPPTPAKNTSEKPVQPSQESSAPQNETKNVQEAQNERAQEDYNQELDYSAYFPNYLKPMPEELIYEWQAQSRPFKKHNRNYYTTIGVIVLLVSLILVFAGQFLPMAVVCAVAFLAYVINSVPPHVIPYQITTYGVRIDQKLYYWELMTRFWYSTKYDQNLLHIEIIEFPDRLTLVLGEAQQEVLTGIFSELLLLEKPPLTLYERMAKWLQDKFPLDLDS